MALDKLVDSTQLDSDLTSVANAIRTKGGTSAQMAFPSGFVSAVEAIETGGGNYDLEVFVETFNSGTRFTSQDLHFIFNKAPTSLKNFMQYMQYPGAYVVDLSKVTFAPPLSNYSATENACAVTGSGKSSITFVMGDNKFFNAGAKCFATTRLSGIYGAKIAPSSFSNNVQNAFYGASNLVDVEFLENHRKSSAYFAYSSVLSDLTLVSLANALEAGAYTLTIHATPKARCSTIMGTVSQVTDGDETYDFFTQDQENGTVTLADFITNTKGWTLA